MVRSAIRAAFLLATLVAAQPVGADFDAGQRAWDTGDVKVPAPFRRCA